MKRDTHPEAVSRKPMRVSDYPVQTGYEVRERCRLKKTNPVRKTWDLPESTCECEREGIHLCMAN